MDALFRPLHEARIVIGRAAQSLDGFIATASGHSRWIGGEDDIRHTHRLRALCDAVVVGAGTIRADDPRLTTRACAGRSPVRVVIDARRQLGTEFRVFSDGAPTLLLSARLEPSRAVSERHGTAEVVPLPMAADGGIDPATILAALAARGLHKILIEGGGRTLARFLRAGALDRLHVTIAPLLLGHGIPAFPRPAAATCEDGLRLSWTVHPLGPDVLLDIPLPCP